MMEGWMMKEKGLHSSMTQQMLQDVETVRTGFALGARVSVTNLGRSTQWRKDLQTLTMMEVVDRTQTAGILLKPEAFTAMLKYIAEVEAERDLAQMDLLITRREHMQSWTAGENLATQAKQRMHERQESTRRMFDDGE
jgi:hypothetical protein